MTTNKMIIIRRLFEYPLGPRINEPLNKIIQQMHNIIAKTNTTIKLMWITSHIGTTRNLLGNKAITSPSSID